MTRDKIIKNLIRITFFSVLFLLIYIAIDTIIFRLDFKDEIEKKNLIIKKYEEMDRLNCEKVSEYSDVIERYTSGTALTIEGKKYSLKDLVNFNQQLRDSISMLSQYLEISKKRAMECETKLDNFYKDYGGKVVYSGESEKKIDSALKLLPHFRDRLTYDSAKNQWYITVTKYSSQQ